MGSVLKTLVCQLRTHGDIIRTFPIIERLRKLHPKSFIAATCYEEMKKTYELCSDLDEIISQPRLKLPVDDVQLTRIMDCKILESSVNKVRAEKFDIYIDFHGVFQSALFGLLANIPIRVGRSYQTTKDGAHLFYNRHVHIENGVINRMYRHLLTAKTVFPGICDVSSKRESNRMVSSLLVVPGSSSLGILKRWPPDKYCSLVNRLAKEYSDTVYVAFGPDEDELFNQMAPELLKNVESVFPNSFDWYLKNLFPQCRCVIGNDCAPLHLAVWKQVPVFMILGPTSPAVNAPWQLGVGSWIAGKHCQKCDPWQQQCDKHQSCLKELSVDDVSIAVREFLKRKELNGV